MKKLTLALAAVLMILTGCKRAQTPALPPAPSPSAAPEIPSPPTVPEPEPSAPLWANLTTEDLSSSLSDLGNFFASSSPQTCLLAQISEPELYFYGLNPGYGGGIILRDGDTLVHFEQEFWALPEIKQGDFSNGGETELAVLWQLQDPLAYDLVFYRSSPGGWSACPVKRDACVEQVSEQLDMDWDNHSHVLTLTFQGQSASKQFPNDAAPGRLVLGHMCLFYESQGKFFVTLDAWSDLLNESLAVFRAEVVYDGDSFSLKNLQMDTMAGV